MQLLTHVEERADTLLVSREGQLLKRHVGRKTAAFAGEKREEGRKRLALVLARRGPLSSSSAFFLPHSSMRASAQGACVPS